MSQLDECKACRENVHISKDEIDRIFGESLKVKDLKLVTLAEYELRMKLCAECEALEYGTTCKFCGCLIPIKAKLAGAKCPYPFKPRW